MKSKLLLCLALVLCGGLMAAQQSNVASSDGRNWGETVGGFQMAISLDETNGIIHCWIRNATTNEMNYPSFDFGYDEFVKLEVQGATNWIGLKPFIFPGGGYSISPVPYEVENIKSGQIITNAVLDGGLNELKQTAVMVAYDDNPNPASLFQQMTNQIESRYALLTNLCRQDTFAFDFVIRNPFSDFTSQSPVKARVSQKFRVNGGKDEITLYSPVFDLPVFTFDSSLIETCIKQQHERIGK
jgi:hypothetical protein